MILGVDTGGTFTDFVLLGNNELAIHKVLSTPEAPERAILRGIDDLGLAAAARRGELLLIHGSTVATNAALQGRGVRTAYITNRGLKDTLAIGRQARAELYNLQPEVSQAPVEDALLLETGGRLDFQGNTIEALSEQDLAQLLEAVDKLKPEAVAINLLYSFVDDQHEKRIEKALPEHLFVSRSSRVLPEYKEYERGIATWLNAWLGPLVEGYVKRLAAAVAPAPVAIMQSSGGTMSAGQAAQRAVNMLLSGPAGGLAGARFLGQCSGLQRLISFDMGGTSSDVALIDGAIKLTNEGHIGPWPVAVPMVDMHTIGAGGGSLAWLDGGGMLHVGPQSSGASPGPACYGRGGTQATVTDAHLVLGRLRPDGLLGGDMPLDVEAAHHAVAELANAMGCAVEAAAEGIIRLANEHMGRALRGISIERGYDPADFALCSFGGAGGLHVCDLAEQLQLGKALIPANAGVLSALGMLVAPRERQLSRTINKGLQGCTDQALEALLGPLAEGGVAELAAEGVAAADIERHYSLDLRYSGQSFTLNLPWQGSCVAATADFHQLHRDRYGHAMEREVELVNLRAHVFAPVDALQLPCAKIDPRHTSYASLFGFEQPVPVLQRQMLGIDEVFTGPMLITEQVASTWLKPGWQLRRDQWDNLLLERIAAQGPA